MKLYRRDRQQRSVVSGKTGYRDEFVQCAETGQLLLPQESEKCEVTGKIVVPGVLLRCEVSKKKVLPSLVERSTVTGKSALKQFFVSSSISGTRALQEESVASAQEVVDTTDAVLELNPVNFPGDWLLNGAGNFNLQHLDAAEKSARRGLELDGQHQFPQLEYLLGAILVQKHDYAGALEHIRNYLRLAPHAADAETAQKQAEELERLSAKTTADK